MGRRTRSPATVVRQKVGAKPRRVQQVRYGKRRCRVRRHALPVYSSPDRIRRIIRYSFIICHDAAFADSGEVAGR
ncbi:hypothetical protein KCP75_19355 [Salmonella enterica subsp. enterica]|nr:hypothetical protein KCP75_19355 [Salmonella enterica subsp. enterica]